ncbi:hypothetical protein C8Q79DRAFT_332829 [Trametes meyenii]|nr:hypothetical protein C8Q79DRAFT_332829 [Trametes meyenii]
MSSDPEIARDISRAHTSLPAPSDSPDDLGSIPVLSKPRADLSLPSASSESSSRVDNITQSSNTPLRAFTYTMKHCKLPIELCEAIMDVLFESPYFAQIGRASEELKTLRACRNVCPEWSIHATALLRLNEVLDSPQAVSTFVSVLWGESRGRLYFRAEDLRLDWSFFQGDRNLSQANALFTLHSLQNLAFLHIEGCHIDIGTSRVVRLRPSFFKGIRSLNIESCEFDSWRTLLDLFWACPYLDSVKIERCSFESDTILTPERATSLSTARRNMRGCEQLDELDIEIFFSEKLSLPPGDVFGSALTELKLRVDTESYDVELHRDLVRFLRSASPQLKNLTVYLSDNPDGVTFQGPSLLHALATGPPVHSALRKVEVSCECVSYREEFNEGLLECIFGRAEEWVGQPLRSHLASLQHLYLTLQSVEVFTHAKACVRITRGLCTPNPSDHTLHYCTLRLAPSVYCVVTCHPYVLPLSTAPKCANSEILFFYLL